MNEEEPSKGEKGEFFRVNLRVVDKLVAVEAGPEEIMAYLVLTRGVNKRGDLMISTHGAQSISTRTGMSYRRAEEALQWLKNQGAIKAAADVPSTPQYMGKGQGQSHRARWVLIEIADLNEIYLANALIEGIGKGRSNPPLMRIYNDVSMAPSGVMGHARLDALMVLLRLYRHHDLTHCGGIDPRAGIYRNWKTTTDNYGDSERDIPGTNAVMYEVEGDLNTVFHSFADEALFYVPDEEERFKRFWPAFYDLKKLGFLYEVSQLWSADPNGKEGRKAELQYTLYVHDRHARDSDPYLQKDIHDLAFSNGAMEGFEFSEDHENTPIGSGRFRFVAKKNTRPHIMGTYRLRFRPKTRDTGSGMDAEQKRVERWAEVLRKLKQ